MNKVFGWALLAFWLVSAVPLQAVAGSPALSPIPVQQAPSPAPQASPPDSPSADLSPRDPRIDEFARELEQRSTVIADGLKDLAELLKRDADVIDNYAQDWAQQLGEELMRKSEELMERSLEKLPRKPVPPPAPPAKPIEI